MQKKILIVDDEPMIREILKEAFEIAKFTVHEAKNGREAFKLVQEIQYNCVLSDVRMPGGDGIELAKNICELIGPKPKVFLVTGFIDMTTLKAKEWGVIKIFEKPFDFRDILEQICDSVNNRHGHSLA
jgi:two-component system response regulator ResD